MSRLLGTALEEFTDFEHSKLLDTLRKLFFQPGVLTREYWSGARKKYIGPVKLFITAFAISVFVYSIVPSTAVFDINASIKNDRTGTYRTLVSKFAAKAQTSTNVFIAEANQRWQRYISWSQILYPLVIAAALKLLFLNRGRYLAEHAVFALHYVTFSLSVSILSWPLYALTGVALSPGFYAVALLNLVLWFVYMFTAMRHVYGGRKVVTAIRAALALSVYYIVFSVTALMCMVAAMFRTANVLHPVP